jgi:hypothetical protein
MNINKVIKIASHRPLTPKEQAIILLWNQTQGRFLNKPKSIPEAVLNFEHVFTDEELEILLVPQETDGTYFIGWENLIESTQTCDLVSYSYFQKSLSLINELPLFLQNHESNLIYSITLGKNINHEDLFSEMCGSFKEYYRFLISVLINQYFLSSAFDNSKDLQSIKTFEILYKIKNSSEDIRTNNIANLLDAVLTITDELIKQYLTVLQHRKIFDNENIFNHSNKIKDYIKITLNQYYPKLFVIEFKPESIFEELL